MIPVHFCGEHAAHAFLVCIIVVSIICCIWRLFLLSVRMLGVLTVSVDGVRLSEDFGPAGRQLCGFLFEFIGRVHRRERLADRFWGHLDPERSRGALYTALWRLRKLLARDPNSDGGHNLRSYGNE